MGRPLPPAGRAEHRIGTPTLVNPTPSDGGGQFLFTVEAVHFSSLFLVELALQPLYGVVPPFPAE